MKSGRQRRREIQEHRRQRRYAHTPKPAIRGAWREMERVPYGAILADQAKLRHDNTYGPRPRYYVDRPFTCIECGREEVWSATDQKWWYEEAKGKIASSANRCLDCRRRRRLRRSQERRVHIEGMVAKHGLEEAAWRLCLTVDALQRMRARWTDSG